MTIGIKKRTMNELRAMHIMTKHALTDLLLSESEPNCIPESFLLLSVIIFFLIGYVFNYSSGRAILAHKYVSNYRE